MPIVFKLKISRLIDCRDQCWTARGVCGCCWQLVMWLPVWCRRRWQVQTTLSG